MDINTTKARDSIVQPESTLTKVSNWLGRIVQAGFFFLYNLPISLGKIISYMFIPAKDAKTISLKERLIEPIPPILIENPEDLKEPPPPPGPLDLSNEELSLFASGLFRLAAATTGLPRRMQWLGGSTMATILFHSSVLTNPTSSMGMLLPLALNSLNYKIQAPSMPMQEQMDTLSMLSLGCAPLATAKQSQLTFNQTIKALNGIKTCINQIGSQNTLLIVRNLAVHSVNIATAGHNLINSLKISAPEFLALTSYVLKYAKSEDYAYQVMGSICPVPFMAATTANTAPPLSENSSIFEKANFIWSKTYSFLSSGPIAQCHYTVGSKENLEYQDWTFKQGLKSLGSEWFGITVHN